MDTSRLGQLKRSGTMGGEHSNSGNNLLASIQAAKGSASPAYNRSSSNLSALRSSIYTHSPGSPSPTHADGDSSNVNTPNKPLPRKATRRNSTFL